MKSAGNLAGVHTCNLNDNKKINEMIKDRNINPVLILDTG